MLWYRHFMVATSLQVTDTRVRRTERPESESERVSVSCNIAAGSGRARPCTPLYRLVDLIASTLCAVEVKQQLLYARRARNKLSFQRRSRLVPSANRNRLSRGYRAAAVGRENELNDGDDVN